jgi:hypothetical protein
MHVLHAQHQADIGEALGPVAMPDGVQDHHLRGLHAGNTRRRHPPAHPARKGMAGDDHPIFDFRKGRRAAGREML